MGPCAWAHAIHRALWTLAGSVSYSHGPKDPNGFQAIMLAALNGNKGVVQILLDKKADVNALGGRNHVFSAIASHFI